MTPIQISRVQRTYSMLAGREEEVGIMFYERLFVADPSLRAMFKTDLPTQSRILMSMLGAAVALLEQPQKLLPALELLGRRHVAYGVMPAHFATVGATLLATLAAVLGPALAAADRTAWAALYGLASGTMQRAAAAMPTTAAA